MKIWSEIDKMGTWTLSVPPLEPLWGARWCPKIRFKEKSDPPGPKGGFWGPKVNFWTFAGGLQNHTLALLAILGPKALFLRKSALFRPHAAVAYKPNGILITMETFWLRSDF